MKLSKEKIQIHLAQMQMGTVDFLRTASISSNTLTRAARGKDVTPKTAGKIARALGVDVTELMEEVKQA